MSKKTLKFDNIRVNKKEFHKSKQPINLDLVNVDQIVVSDKFKHSDDGFKYFIGYKEGEIVKPLCIILPQMTGYIKYFENGGKNMSFVIKDDDVLDKYNEIWDKIKETLSIKFHSMPVYDEKYIKAKVREFNGVIKTNNFRPWNTKRKHALHLHYLYNYWFCCENGKKELSTSLFRRMQIQIKENKDDQIHKHWIRVRFRIWHWIRVKARTWFWEVVFLLFIAIF